MDEKKSGIGLILGLGKPSSKDDEEPSSKGMACKALMKAIKNDDHEAFGDALDLFLDARESGAADSKDDSDDDY